MKKRAILILSAMMATGMLFTGCSSSGNNQKTEKSEEETKYADEQFIKDMSKGLQARWDLIDKNEKKDEEVDPQSQEEKDMTLDCIQAELDCVEKYTDEKFNDSKLQEYAVKYVNLLKQHKDACKYIPVDYYGKYSEELDSIYNERSKIIEDLVENYNLTVDKKHQDTLDEFKTNSQLVKDQDAMEESVKNMLANIQFTEVSNEDGWKTYQGVVENTTGKDISIFIALSDSKSSVNTSKKKHIGYVDEQLEMTDEEKIEKASELFGKEVEDGSVSCSQDFVDFAEQATLFGHDVEITPIISNGITSDIVDTVMWTTQDTIDKEDLNNIVESLCDLYGEYDESDIDYKEIQDGYQWEEPSDYSLVACGMNEDKDEIIMYWVE